MTDNMYQFEVVALRLPESAELWYLAVSFMRLRAEVFVRKLGWQLPVADEMEHEQYDIAALPTYIVAHQDGRVLGGARLLRCDVEVGSGSGIISYMIRDAYEGRSSLPQEICFDPPPTDSGSWELTRLTSTSSNPQVLTAVLEAANAYVCDQGGHQCLCLASPAIMRIARRHGFQPRAIGPTLGNRDGRFIAFTCTPKG